MASPKPFEEVEMVDVGVGAYIHETPSTRFPVYTRGNVGEVWPEVVFPLTASMARRADIEILVRPFTSIGMLFPRDFAEGPLALGAIFGGYQYLNLSLVRTVAVRTPGMTIEENDAIYMGAEASAPAYRPHPDDKSIKASINAVRFAWGMLNTDSLPQLLEDERTVAARAALLPGAMAGPHAELMAYARENVVPVFELFAWHLEVSAKAGAAVALLSRLCRDFLKDESLALTMLGGLGDVASAAPSFALWDLGRQVAADPVLTALFDDGLDDLPDRLGSTNATGAVAVFNEAFRAFLDTFGSRGPNEWEAASPTWGLQPRLPLAVIDRMRLADAAQDPAAQNARLARERAEAIEDAKCRLKRPQRWIFNKALQAASVYSRAREQSKTTVVGLIHLSRRALHELGTRLQSETGQGEVDDLFYLLDSEIDAYLVAPLEFSELIADRRAVRSRLAQRVPPFVIDGHVPHPATWPQRSDVTRASARVGETMSGLAGCPGEAEGIARVVTDPSALSALDPGDILVAPLTDPAWTPLFVTCSGVVVNVGGQMSHAVIVSRELGLPCVVGIEDATLRIPDGARIRVDGTNGSVTVLSESSEK